jgi:hypothetical protein
MGLQSSDRSPFLFPNKVRYARIKILKLIFLYGNYKS